MKPSKGPYHFKQLSDFKFIIANNRRVLATVEQSYDEAGVGVSSNQLKANAALLAASIQLLDLVQQSRQFVPEDLAFKIDSLLGEIAGKPAKQKSYKLKPVTFEEQSIEI